MQDHVMFLSQSTLRGQYRIARRDTSVISIKYSLDGTVHIAEVHWYEAHGIGKKEFKIKFALLD